MQTRVHQKYLERMKRTYHILQGFNPYLADEVFNQRREHTRQKTRRPEEAAAVVIQTRYRGYRARKVYADMLYAQYEAFEEKARDEEMRRVEEGMLLLSSLHLQQEIKQKQFLSRQKDIERHFAARVIQRAYRRWKSLPVPLSAVTVIQGEAETLREEQVSEVPRSPWREEVQQLSDLSDASSDSASSDSEVFQRLHPVSRDISFSIDMPEALPSSERFDLSQPDELSNTASSVLSGDMRSLGNTCDFSMTQYMRKSEPPWGGPQAMPTLRSALTGLTPHPRTMRREELQSKPLSALQRKAAWLSSRIASLHQTLQSLSDKRQTLLSSLDFSKQLIAYLSAL